MIEYKNSKTNSKLYIPDEIKLSEVDDYAYLIKMMIWNDERILKNKVQQLVNCLKKIKVQKEALNG